MLLLLLKPSRIFKSGVGEEEAGRKRKRKGGEGGREAKSGREKEKSKRRKENVFKGIYSSNPKAMTLFI